MLRPNKTRAKTIIIFMILVLVLDVAFIVSSYLQANLLENVRAGIVITSAEANANDIRHIAIVFLRALVGIGAIITFIMWFRRGYFNLHQRVDNLAFTEGWAAGAWFVPFVNLWRPVQIMSEMNRETQELLVKENLMTPKKAMSFLIPAWWTVWLGAGVINGIMGSMHSRDRLNPTLDGLIAETYSDLYQTYIGMPAAIIVILIIRSYSKMEDLLPLVNTPAAEQPVLSDGDLLDR